MFQTVVTFLSKAMLRVGLKLTVLFAECEGASFLVPFSFCCFEESLGCCWSEPLAAAFACLASVAGCSIGGCPSFN